MIVVQQQVIRKLNRRPYLAAYLRTLAIYTVPLLYRVPENRSRRFPAPVIHRSRKPVWLLQAISGGVPVGVLAPAVVGLSSSVAISHIQAAGLIAATITASSRTVPAGIVIAQSPSALTLMFTGQILTITVSVGAPVYASNPDYIVSLLPRTFTASLPPRTFTVVSHTPMQRFDIKDPAESVPLTFNFGPDLATGETLTGTPSLSIVVTAGVDPNPTAILNGNIGFDTTNTQLIQPVTGGINGTEYQFIMTCPTTNANKTLTCVGVLPVRR